MQVCVGLEGGGEAAVHAMSGIFCNDTEGIPLVDVANAFNNLNRKAALYNMNFICPTLATILTNPYQSPNWMFISVRDEVLSSEGTTQGDPLGPSVVC